MPGELIPTPALPGSGSRGMFSAHKSTPDERIVFCYPIIVSNLCLEIDLDKFFNERRFISNCSLKKLKESEFFLWDIMKKPYNLV